MAFSACITAGSTSLASGAAVVVAGVAAGVVVELADERVAGGGVLLQAAIKTTSRLKAGKRAIVTSSRRERVGSKLATDARNPHNFIDISLALLDF
ncbi:hypothetical protein [Cupriavidus pampae]|uniref:hypothetical protein n=1 Tax=Cupriavidus pampae TaxID=659251 RepID=UPI001CC79384|nr:hypothetical protein [Cupriavidus pampae]